MARGLVAKASLAFLARSSAFIAPPVAFTAARPSLVNMRTRSAPALVEPPNASTGRSILESAVDESGQRWESPLESTMVAENLSFADKMEVIDAYFEARPLEVAGRLATVAAAGARVAAAWIWEEKFRPGSEARGDVLRREVSSLGVVFVKVAQTLATREDLVGAEAAAALGVLQDGNKPFSDAVAMAMIREDLNWPGVLAPEQASPSASGSNLLAQPTSANDDTISTTGSDGSSADGASPSTLFAHLSESPLAAASLAQVYQATTHEGATVAVKVRRPGVVDQIARDVHTLRIMLELLRQYWGSTTDIPAISNEVASGLFSEVDLRREAKNLKLFAEAHAHLPYVTVPRSAPLLSARRVLTMEWVDGEKLPNLPLEDQKLMVAAGLDACFAQLLGTGVVHADPHYGNMLWTKDGRLALLDFGLVTSTTAPQRDAMARAILCLLAEDWDGLIDAYRLIGIVPDQPCRWVNPKTGQPTSGLGPGAWAKCPEDEFRQEFRSAMTKRGEGRRSARSFSELTADLSVLALDYKFVLPAWMVFIVRAVITLDGFALKGSSGSSENQQENAASVEALETAVALASSSSSSPQEELVNANAPSSSGGKTKMEASTNAVEAAYPHAARRVLAPTTPAGVTALSAAFVDESTGDLKWDRLSALLSDPTKSTTQEEAEEVTASSSSPGEGDSSAFVKPLTGLLLEPQDGKALRRLVHSQLKTKALINRAFSMVAAELNPFKPVSPTARTAVTTATSKLKETLREGSSSSCLDGRSADSDIPATATITATAAPAALDEIPAGRAAADWPGGTALFGAYPSPKGRSPTQRARNWQRVVATVGGSHLRRALVPWSSANLHGSSSSRTSSTSAEATTTATIPITSKRLVTRAPRNGSGGSVFLTCRAALLAAAIATLALRVGLDALWLHTCSTVARAMRGLLPWKRSDEEKGLQPATA